ncbi:MAG TPA: type II secretion system inner membrane protein GspF [Deltaproteobacteria bacterium]|nr:type II secretion system inner membrane protein GspF [Deltaproteobacteria bacterium]HPP79992.1 type II secretion system inner membrane protein GspF [Deltaproteobacteria bacterium]
MAVYSWTGYTQKGKTASGMIDAASVREAKLKLMSQGMFVSSIAEASREVRPSSRAFSIEALLGRVSTEDLAVATRQLSTLVGAAIPLVDALTALFEQTESPTMKRTIAQVKDSVNEGVSFADALSRHRRIFPELYVNMVRSGEASGALDVVLLRLAEFLEGQHRLKSRVQAALVYPAVLLLVSIVVLMYLLTAVVPKVVGMFETMNQVLPLPTRVLIGLSAFVSRTWWILLVAVALSLYALKRWRATPRGAELFDRFRMRVPIYGGVFRKVSVARFARTLGTLLASGVPIVEALRIVKAVVVNKVMEIAIEDTITEVIEGSSLSAPLRRSGVFPPLLVHMIGVGEKSGNLEEMLVKAAQSYESDVETTVSGLASVLEPVMILFMGGVVGFVVMSILMPMLEMSTIVR